MSSTSDLKDKLELIDRNPLNIDEDLADILDIVFPVATDWKEVGVKLYIPTATLNVIESDKRDVKNCLLELLATWLQSNYDTEKHGKPTWRQLAEAVSQINGDVFWQIAEMHKVTIASASPHPVTNTMCKEQTVTHNTAETHEALLQRPTTRQLALIKYKDSKGCKCTVRPEQTLAPEWREMGRLFGFDDAKLSIWDTQFRNDKDRAHAVLAHWLDDGSKNYPLNWVGLRELFEDLELREHFRPIETGVIAEYAKPH